MAAGDNVPAAQIKEPTFNHDPKYKLTEPAYIGDEYLNAEKEITFKGIPGHHMEPLNDHAKHMKKKHDREYVDPIEAMTRVG
jgi:hypothetical protein